MERKAVVRGDRMSHLSGKILLDRTNLMELEDAEFGGLTNK